jgi:hypothetical protein
MPEEMNQMFILGIIALLFIWLIYRIRCGVRRLIEREIFKNFPTIKDSMENFGRRMEYLKIEIELLEKKLKELEKRRQGL